MHGSFDPFAGTPRIVSPVVVRVSETVACNFVQATATLWGPDRHSCLLAAQNQIGGRP